VPSTARVAEQVSEAVAEMKLEHIVHGHSSKFTAGLDGADGVAKS
jgi:hypothetical protein